MPEFDDTNNALDELDTALDEALSEFEQTDRRTVCRRFYVSEIEAQQLEELRRGISLSAFVRSKVLSAGIPRPKAIVPQINREVQAHFAGVRGNCNQIAKAINVAASRGEVLPLGIAYLDQLQRVEEQLRAIGLQLEQMNQMNQPEIEDDWQSTTEQ